MTEAINILSKQIIERLKDNLEALILVGSYARGEGIEGVSDIEFLAVVRGVRSVEAVGFDMNTGLKFATKNHLKRLKPYIFTVELKKYGNVFWGDKEILGLIPEYQFEDIDKSDGFTLLNNRIVEQLILWGKINDGVQVFQYDFDKGYIQLVNSYLVFNNKYRGLYPEKEEMFINTYKDSGSGLVNMVKEAFKSIKNSPTSVVKQDTANQNWLELRGYFREIWLYERNNLMNIKHSDGIKSRLKKWLHSMLYHKAANIYFSDHYLNDLKRKQVIRYWERFIK